MQSSVAVSANDGEWFLLNASPDVRFQIESFPPLQSPKEQKRGTSIQAVLLTNADLDHSLGLVSLREGLRLKVHASENTQRWLSNGFHLAGLLDSFCGIDWITPPRQNAALFAPGRNPSGLEYRAVSLPGKPPRWANSFPSNEGTLGYYITDQRSGGRLLFMPDVESLTNEAMALLDDADLVLFDGTFWSETEMIDAGLSSATAKQMGHMPISGEQGSLKILAKARARQKIYLHINNTNPILLEDSAERHAVEAAGVQVGMDGMEFEI